MLDSNPFTITFDHQHRATAIQVDANEDPARVLTALDLPPYQGVIVVHGGADNMAEELVNTVRRFVVAGLGPLAQQRDLLIVDGGTHTGTSQVMGEARQEIGGTYPLIGVLPHHFASYPGGPAPEERQRILLNPSHSHFVFVSGDEFGVESPLLVGLLRAARRPGVALIINGGEIVLKEVIQHAHEGNLLVTLNKSGRIADRLADCASAERRSLPVGTRLWVVDIDAPDQCVALLNMLLDRPAYSPH
jgi:hypothetical protein